MSNVDVKKYELIVHFQTYLEPSSPTRTFKLPQDAPMLSNGDVVTLEGKKYEVDFKKAFVKTDVASAEYLSLIHI